MKLGDGRLRIPKEIVDRAINESERNLIYLVRPKTCLHVNGSRVYFAAGGAAVMIAQKIRLP